MKLQYARAFMFTPGDQEKKVLKSIQRTDCAVVLDLEDAVMPDNKPVARDTLRRCLKEEHACEAIVIRINAPEAGYLAEDMAFIEDVMPDAIMLPKGNIANATALTEALKGIESRTGVMIPVIPIVETALGFEEMHEFLKILPCVPFASFGGEDLATDLRVKPEPGSNKFDYAKWRFVFGCAAYGIQPIDTVYVNIHDIEGLEKEIAHVRSMGMMGKACIHPLHVEPINKGFSPSEAEIAEARLIVETASLPENQGKGAIQVNGKMVDIPVVRRAEDVLKRAQQ